MKKNNLLISSLIFLVLFALIAINLNTQFLINLDNSMALFSATHQTNFLQTSSLIINTLFEPTYIIILLTIISIILWIYKKKTYSILLLLTSAAGGILIYLLKYAFARARPISSLIVDSGFSFPSGHTLISTILFGILIFLSLRIKSQLKKIVSIIICISGMAIVGLGRVYLNVHWFSDVIASYCLGLFLVFGALCLYDFLKIKHINN